MNLTILSLFAVAIAWAAPSSKQVADVAPMERRLRQSMSCRLSPESINIFKVKDSANCYHRFFSMTLSQREKSGLASWFNSLERIERISGCEGKNYHLESYYSYTPFFLCAEVRDLGGETVSVVLFFQMEERQFRLATVYRPFSWRKQKS